MPKAEEPNPNPVDCWVVGVPNVFVLPNAGAGAGEPKAGAAVLVAPNPDVPNDG